MDVYCLRLHKFWLLRDYKISLSALSLQVTSLDNDLSPFSSTRGGEVGAATETVQSCDWIEASCDWQITGNSLYSRKFAWKRKKVDWEKPRKKWRDRGSFFCMFWRCIPMKYWNSWDIMLCFFQTPFQILVLLSWLLIFISITNLLRIHHKINRVFLINFKWQNQHLFSPSPRRNMFVDSTCQTARQ